MFFHPRAKFKRLIPQKAKSIDDSNWFIGMQQKENSIKEGSCPLFCVFVTIPVESSMTHNKLKMKIWVHCRGDFVIRVCVLSCDSWEGDIDVGVKFQMKMTKNQSFIVYSILNNKQWGWEVVRESHILL